MGQALSVHPSVHPWTGYEITKKIIFRIMLFWYVSYIGTYLQTDTIENQNPNLFKMCITTQ